MEGRILFWVRYDKPNPGDDPQDGMEKETLAGSPFLIGGHLSLKAFYFSLFL
jgi:hypothetical protein